MAKCTTHELDLPSCLAILNTSENGIQGLRRNSLSPADPTLDSVVIIVAIKERPGLRAKNYWCSQNVILVAVSRTSDLLARCSGINHCVWQAKSNSLMIVRFILLHKPNNSLVVPVVDFDRFEMIQRFAIRQNDQRKERFGGTKLVAKIKSYVRNVTNRTWSVWTFSFQTWFQGILRSSLRE